MPLQPCGYPTHRTKKYNWTTKSYIFYNKQRNTLPTASNKPTSSEDQYATSC